MLRCLVLLDQRRREGQYRPVLTVAQRRILLGLARQALTRATSAGQPIELDKNQLQSLEPALLERCGAFVSLHTSHGDIRGCVGCMTSERPVAAVVVEMAGAAALRDPRFPPVAPSEAGDLEIEISVLGAMHPIGSLNEVEIGRDGLLASGSGRRGVLLPQVASERGWDRETFAAQTCVKAGLDPNAYARGDAQLSSFSAEVFNESELERPAEGL
jgi:AmmeMemoRadiSam system protein A